AFVDREDDASSLQARAERRRQPFGEPGVPLGPGEKAFAAFAAARLLAGRAKAVPAREVMQSCPRRHVGAAGAVVVAAAVVEVPAQRGGRETVAVEPGGEGDAVERGQRIVPARARGRGRERA